MMTRPSHSSHCRALHYCFLSSSQVDDMSTINSRVIPALVLKYCIAMPRPAVQTFGASRFPLPASHCQPTSWFGFFWRRSYNTQKDTSTKEWAQSLTSPSQFKVLKDAPSEEVTEGAERCKQPDAECKRVCEHQWHFGAKK